MSRGGREPNCSLFVRNVPDDAKSSEIRNIFGKFGPLKDVYIPVDYYTRRPRGFAYVQFEDPRDAREARDDLHGYVYLSSELSVDYARGDRKTPNQMRGRERPYHNDRYRDYDRYRDDDHHRDRRFDDDYRRDRRHDDDDYRRDRRRRDRRDDDDSRHDRSRSRSRSERYRKRVTRSRSRSNHSPSERQRARDSPIPTNAVNRREDSLRSNSYRSPRRDEDIRGSPRREANGNQQPLYEDD